MLLVIYGLSAVFTYAEHYIMATVTLELSRDLRQDLSRKINHVPMEYFNRVSYGDILSRVTNDVSTLQQAMANSLRTALLEQLDELKGYDMPALLERRYERLMSYGIA